MRYRSLPSAEYLNACFSYDPETGSLTWRHRADKLPQLNARQVGKEAGRLHPVKGHRQVELDGVNYQVHRIIVKMVTGEEPPEQVDHEDGDGSNNCWCNLRVATHGQNRANAKQVTPLPRGVTRNWKRFGAQIVHENKLRWLGTFDTPEEAHAAYRKAAEELHGKFAYHVSRSEDD